MFYLHTEISQEWSKLTIMITDQQRLVRRLKWHIQTEESSHVKEKYIGIKKRAKNQLT